MWFNDLRVQRFKDCRGVACRDFQKNNEIYLEVSNRCITFASYNNGVSYCRIGRLGNSSITLNEPRLVPNINGGLQPSGKQITKTFGHSNLVIGSFVFFHRCGFYIKGQICESSLPFFGTQMTRICTENF